MSFRQQSDTGIILKKTTYRDNAIRISIFSKEKGKIIIWGYGVKKVTSRRISHLETGNYLKFNYQINRDRFSLLETELIYGHSKIKHNLNKLQLMYQILFILDRILPEGVEEKVIFNQILDFLRRLNNSDSDFGMEKDKLINQLLLILGYIDKQAIETSQFDQEEMLQEIIGKRLPKSF